MSNKEKKPDLRKTPEYRARLSALKKALHATPEFKENHRRATSNGVKAHLEDPAALKKWSEKSKKNITALHEKGALKGKGASRRLDIPDHLRPEYNRQRIKFGAAYARWGIFVLRVRAKDPEIVK